MKGDDVVSACRDKVLIIEAGLPRPGLGPVSNDVGFERMTESLSTSAFHTWSSDSIDATPR